MIRVGYLASMMDNLGGAERVNFQVLTRLQHKGFATRAIFMKRAGDIGKKLPDEGVPIHVLSGTSKVQFFRLLRQVMRIMSEQPLDILFTGEDRLCMATAALLRGKKLVSRYVICFHNTRMPQKIGKLVHPLAVRVADAYVVLSERNKMFWQRHYNLPDSKIWIIPNGIPLDAARTLSSPEKRAERLRRGLSAERFTVGLVTFFKDFKNLPGFVQVARMVVDLGVDAQFVLAGTGPEYPKVQSAIRDLDLESRFFLPGKVNSAMEWYPLCDLALLTSSSSEAFPLTLIEAMACGLPVVATDIAGVPDIVIHGETGFLAAPNELLKLAEYVAQIARNPELYHFLSTAGRRRAFTEFDVEVMVERYAQMFESLVCKSRC